MTFQHRAGVRPYTSSCDLAESCVFDKQSLGPFRCDPHALGELSPVTSRGHSFSRSYGVSVPSSLTIVLPIASVFSTRPPVSVLVRAPTRLPRGFSRGHGVTGFTHSLRLAPRRSCRALRCGAPARFHGDVQNPARLPFPVTPSVVAARRRCGNVCPLRIGYASRPRLSTRLTLGGLASPRKPWTFGGGVSRAPLATHASILASRKSTRGRPSRFAPPGTLPYRRARMRVPPLRHHA